ncbi:fungal-specific transcription factor domain-containing protein [Aspergillus karnatakaensis]|uniref:transcription factor domain-containing protein n=1 Tax=Aspergillus karnatakaensis TaxID=1810916 RepID=UPI003CCD5359
MATFTKEFPSVRSDLLVLMTTSPILDNAIRAIGALTASRQGARAISALRVALLDRGLVRGDDVLWATFLLGVFELHSDCSGEGYVSHVFHGTSALLQLTGPSSSMTPLRRAFYDIFRVVEASRALPHCESTILTEPTWLRFQQMQQESRDYWDPLDEISTLMIDASTFILRARETTSRIFAANRDTNPSVLSLAMEGLKIQQTIYHWHDQTLAHRSQGHPSTNIDLALLEYHALLLFILSDSRAFPNCIYPPGPRLTPAETRDHVTAILDLCARILQLRSAPGILLCFPLLIAGSQIPVQDQRARVLCLVHRVLCSGFGSAKRVRETLMQCWSVCDAEEHVRQRCVAGV